MKKQKSFSEKILQRRALRRKKLAKNIISVSLIFLSLLFVSWAWHKDNVENKIRLKEAAPTWANFIKLDDPKGEQYEQYVVTVKDQITGVPTVVNINSEQWSIVHVDKFNEDNVGGETFCQNKTIAYLYDENEMELRETIMHEVFHAGACAHNGDKWYDCSTVSRTEHKCIYNMSYFLTNFSMTNKYFMEWYIKE